MSWNLISKIGHPLVPLNFNCILTHCKPFLKGRPCISLLEMSLAFVPSVTALVSLPTTVTSQHAICTAVSSFVYIASANMCYLARRSFIRSAYDPTMTKYKLFRIRTTREPGVSHRFYIVLVLAWQLFVLTVFPLAEPLAKLFNRTIFYYTYPNAHGAGIILEPLDAQHLKPNKRDQIRFDWHRFSVNVGAVGRDGFRHPPSVDLNRPHLDLPGRGMKHWPWRRRVDRREKH